MNDVGSTSAQQDNIPAAAPSDDNPSPVLPRPFISEQDSAAVNLDVSRARRAQLRHLLTQIDGTLYILLCAMYYIDCSSILFFVRSLLQLIYLTPKPAELPIPKPTSSSPSIIIANVMCVLLHVILHTPTGNDTVRGYLHGSLFIDFIGQKGPTSKVRLVVYDIVILSLQLLCFVITVLERQEVEKGKKSRRGSRRRRRRAWVEELLTGASASRNDGETVDGSIEMDDLQPSGRASSDPPEHAVNDANETEENNEQGEESTLLANRVEERESSTSQLEQFAAGQVVIADFHIWDAIQNDVYEARNQIRSRGRI